MTNASKTSQDETLNPGLLQTLEQREPLPDSAQLDPICAKCGVTRLLSNAEPPADAPSPSINPICANCWVAAMHKS